MNASSSNLTPEQKYQKMFEGWLSPAGVEFVNPEAEALYKQRLNRLNDTIQLRVPDRVPFMPTFEMYPAYYGGLNVEEAMSDYDKAYVAWKKTILDVEPDLYINGILAYPSKAFDALDYKLMKWPGRHLRPTQLYQFIDGEYMKPDEYDHFLADPTDYMMRKYYPRVFGILEPLTILPPLHNGIWLGMLGLVGMFGVPGVGEAFTKLAKAGEEMLAWFSYLARFDKEIQGLGFPNFVGGMSFAPFDLLGDTMRGTRGIMMDMFRQPDKLLAGIDKMTEFAIDMGVSSGKSAGIPMVWMFLHKGPKGFMSDEQFRTFYWPSMQKLICALVEEGLTPCVYTEGDYTPRLEYLADVPKGKVLYHFETVDMHKAKEILGGVACISGNVPLGLLATGSVEEVEAYCKNLIDVVGKDGGFIMDASAAIDEARPENIKAMGDITKTYGVYR